VLWPSNTSNNGLPAAAHFKGCLTSHPLNNLLSTHSDSILCARDFPFHPFIVHALASNIMYGGMSCPVALTQAIIRKGDLIVNVRMECLNEQTDRVHYQAKRCDDKKEKLLNSLSYITYTMWMILVRHWPPKVITKRGQKKV